VEVCITLHAGLVSSREKRSGEAGKMRKSTLLWVSVLDFTHRQRESQAQYKHLPVSTVTAGVVPAMAIRVATGLQFAQENF
jgi:hypothetical protein